MSLNTSDIQRYFQFCENYQNMCNNMLDNQIIMFNNLYNLINNNNSRFRRTPYNSFSRNNNGFRRRQNTAFRNNTISSTSNVPTTSPVNNTRRYVFPLNLNNFENDLNNGVRNIFNELISNRQNTFFDNVPVVPTEEQIDNACDMITYSQDASGQQMCPISLTRFNNGQQVMRIRQCGHVFIEENLRHWFTLNPRCPICRYDIREYLNSNNNENDENKDDNEDEDENKDDNGYENDNEENDNENVDISDNRTTEPATFMPYNTSSTTTTTNTTPINITTSSNDSFNRLFVSAFQSLLSPTINDTSMNQNILNFQYTLFDPNNVD